MHRLVLVGWNEVFARVKAFALTVKIDPKRRLLREPRRSCVGQGWRQRTSALNEMNAPACVDPGMCNGTCRATTSTHAKDSTTVRTTTGQTSHGHHASPVRAGGANISPLEPEGVHAEQGVGIVDAVPISDEMFQRGGEAQPSPFLGMKRRGRGRAWTWALDKTRLHGTMQTALRKRRFSHLLKHAFHGGCFDAQGPRMLQCDPFDTGFLKPRDRQKKEQGRG